MLQQWKCNVVPSSSMGTARAVDESWANFLKLNPVSTCYLSLLHVASAVRARDGSSRFPFKRWTRPNQSHSKRLRRKKKILKQRLNASRTIRRLMCEGRSQQISKWVTSRMREKSQISPQCVQQGSGCRTDSRSQELLDGNQNCLGGGDSTFLEGVSKVVEPHHFMNGDEEWMMFNIHQPRYEFKGCGPFGKADSFRTTAKSTAEWDKRNVLMLYTKQSNAAA